MEKDLIKNLGPSEIVRWDFNISLKNLNILIMTDIDKNLSKFYELKAIITKELYISSENLEILPRADSLVLLKIKYFKERFRKNGTNYINPFK